MTDKYKRKVVSAHAAVIQTLKVRPVKPAQFSLKPAPVNAVFHVPAHKQRAACQV